MTKIIRCPRHLKADLRNFRDNLLGEGAIIIEERFDGDYDVGCSSSADATQVRGIISICSAILGRTHEQQPNQR